MAWVKSQQDDPMIDQFNPGSVLQLQQLFFAPFTRDHSKKQKKESPIAKSEVREEHDDEGPNKSDGSEDEGETRPIIEATPRPNNPRKTDADDWPKERIFKIENTKVVNLALFQLFY
jgi:hypothetical protein